MESLPRIDFFELHDLDGTPPVLRTLHTESIMTIYRLTDAAREYSRPLALALRSGADHRIVDLCAGSGGPVPLIQRRLHAQGVHTQVTLTDLVPNVPAFERVARQNRRRLPDPCCSVDHVASSVDATDCRLEGTRTIYGAFHHFPPALAARMLQNAVDTRQPMVVVDTKRSWLYVLVFPFFLTLAVLLAAPFQRNPLPRYLMRLALTYVVPVLPIMMFFDSVVSFLRMYGRAELRRIVDGLDRTESFDWTIGVEPGFTGTQYLIGIPRRP
ncbi:class I SAM-dependent methyltransferase [Streptomyces sp. ID05-26A]|nr:class I SAM-dependent methyltransferase [Streptomyces sp. ID05-26A]